MWVVPSDVPSWGPRSWLQASTQSSLWVERRLGECGMTPPTMLSSDVPSQWTPAARLLSAPTDVPVPDIPHGRAHTPCDRVCPASVAEHLVPEVRARGRYVPCSPSDGRWLWSAGLPGVSGYMCVCRNTCFRFLGAVIARSYGECVFGALGTRFPTHWPPRVARSGGLSPAWAPRRSAHSTLRKTTYWALRRALSPVPARLSGMGVWSPRAQMVRPSRAHPVLSWGILHLFSCRGFSLLGCLGSRGAGQLSGHFLGVSGMLRRRQAPLSELRPARQSRPAGQSWSWRPTWVRERSRGHSEERPEARASIWMFASWSEAAGEGVRVVPTLGLV